MSCDWSEMVVIMSCDCSEAMRSAVEQLDLLGAVGRKGEQVTLTPLGKKMASFPLEPRYAKVRHRHTGKGLFIGGCLY